VCYLIPLGFKYSPLHLISYGLSLHSFLDVSLCGPFLAADSEVRVRFPALTDFLRICGSGAGFAQPRGYNWGSACKRKWRFRCRWPRMRLWGSVTLTMCYPLSAKLALTSQTSAGRSVGIIRSCNQATGVFLCSAITNLKFINTTK
jgi:hypothetical protein